ncbi:MAG: FkbM family methyltransferase [Pseudomonadota bacterium]|nr:FkbM family methyltransferase [Pseudomonadota bacterium]
MWRALKHVEKGNYIDVGAWEPEDDSVSKAFYDKGWRGVHVEPVPIYAEKLRQARPDEVVVEAAIGLGGDTAEITVIAETGLSTGEPDIAARHLALPYTQTKIKVAKMPLSALFENHATGEVHWLKIDVEGMEKEVLQSWQQHPARPWILILESTLPNKPIQNHETWESEVLARGYQFVYFDGLNRFYVHENCPELQSAFGPGPNVFDDYVLATTAAQAKTIAALQHERANLASQLYQSDTTTAAQAETIAALQRERANIASQLQQNAATTAAQAEIIDAIQRERKNLAAQLQHSEAAAVSAKETIEVMENSFSWRSTALLRYLVKNKS